MTPEAVFAAYDLLSWIPPGQIVKIRRTLDVRMVANGRGGPLRPKPITSSST
jgi:hypothetical protein